MRFLAYAAAALKNQYLSDLSDLRFKIFKPGTFILSECGTNVVHRCLIFGHEVLREMIRQVKSSLNAGNLSPEGMNFLIGFHFGLKEKASLYDYRCRKCSLR